MGIKALIFDFDGLILDTESPMRTSWMEIFESSGLGVSDEDWASLLGASADPPEAYALLEAHLGRSIDRKELHHQRMTRELELLEAEAILPGVRSLIAEAQASKLKLAVASSSERAWVEGLLSRHRLLSRFDVIVCAEDVSETKPAPDLFLSALDRLGIESDEAIVFEDSHHGVAAARRASIFVVAVPNRVTQCLDFSHANLRIRSIAEHSLSEFVAAATR